MAPRVSVVVPTRDRLTTLRRALAGVDGQRFRDLEVVVVDDGSTDGTVGWLRSHRPNVRVVATAGAAGAASARNLGVEAARGELIAFLDDDDAWHPGYLEAQVAELDASPSASLSYAGHVEVHRSGRRTCPDTETLLRGATPLVRLLAESHIHTLSVVVCRREAFERLGRLDESLAIVHDLDWYARVLAAGGRIVNVPRPLVERSVPGGLVRSHRAWFREDSAVTARALERSGEDDRLVHAYRSLYFARIALAKGDLAFGFARLAGAFRASPHWTVRLAGMRLLRRADRGRRRVDAELVGAPAEARL